jgi:hypothetical protein
MVHLMKQIQIGDISLPTFLSTLGGIFIILGSASLFAMLILHESSLSLGTLWHLYPITSPYWLAFIVGMSISVGGLIVYFSHEMYKHPEQKLWAVLITLWSLVSLFYLREFGLGGILGLLGSIMALRSKNRYMLSRQWL